jgi:hypothetical protein
MLSGAPGLKRRSDRGYDNYYSAEACRTRFQFRSHSACRLGVDAVEKGLAIFGEQ